MKQDWNRARAGCRRVWKAFQYACTVGSGCVECQGGGGGAAVRL